MITKKTLLAYLLDLDMEMSALRAKMEDLESKITPPKKASKAKAKEEKVETPKRSVGRPKKTA